jgi:signal transduction histidine kinase
MDSILIVDDERGIRDTLRAVMEDEGFVADAVASGEDCLKALGKRAYGCILLDVEQIKRVFVNLIDNALDALVSVGDEKVVTITTSRDIETGLVRVEVADTGQGIAPADFRRLFEPYFSRRDSGTGLGLAIVQRIILEHGGTIRAEKNEPRGARFVINLPVNT